MNANANTLTANHYVAIKPVNYDNLSMDRLFDAFGHVPTFEELDAYADEIARERCERFNFPDFHNVYTYTTVLDLEVGDICVCPYGKRFVLGMVIDANAPKPDYKGNLKPIVKVFTPS